MNNFNSINNLHETLKVFLTDESSKSLMSKYIGVCQMFIKEIEFIDKKNSSIAKMF